MFKNILCPVDMHPRSKMALRKAINIVHQFNSKIVLLSIQVKLFNEMNIDLIVMGTNGRVSLSDYIIGSTTHKVVEKSKCPGLIIPKGKQ